jgi:hypothetical protein
VSTDSGGSWVERPTPFSPTTEAAVYVAAVDPANADRVYVRSDGQSRLLVTSDAGRSYTVALAFTGQMLGFALSSDGATVYAGGPQDGIFAGSSTGLAFRKTSTLQVQCLGAQGVELWACSSAPGEFVAGVSADDGAHFATKLEWSGLEGPLACPSAAATAAQCGGQAFQQLCQTLQGCVSLLAEDDGGIVEGGAPVLVDSGVAPVVVPVVKSSSCGCSAAGSGRGGFGLVVAVCLAMAAAVRRHRRQGVAGMVTGTRASLLP